MQSSSMPGSPDVQKASDARRPEEASAGFVPYETDLQPVEQKLDSISTATGTTSELPQGRLRNFRRFSALKLAACPLRVQRRWPLSTSGVVIGIDPGRHKCGLAVVHKQEGLLALTVVGTINLATAVGDFSSRYHTTTIILGNGTSHREAKTALDSAAAYTIHIIDEAHTTEEARIRYWVENPPQGLRRLIPLGLQTPPEPVDGYVAAILAERWLQGRETY